MECAEGVNTVVMLWKTCSLMECVQFIGQVQAPDTRWTFGFWQGRGSSGRVQRPHPYLTLHCAALALKKNLLK
jgi:hypothetical protein